MPAEGQVIRNRLNFPLQLVPQRAAVKQPFPTPLAKALSLAEGPAKGKGDAHLLLSHAGLGTGPPNRLEVKGKDSLFGVAFRPDETCKHFSKVPRML